VAATDRNDETDGRLDALAREIAETRAQLLEARTRMLQDLDRKMVALDALHARAAAVLDAQKTARGSRPAARTSVVAEEFRALKDRLGAVIMRLDGHFGF
jgi:hypothetical protein